MHNGLRHIALGISIVVHSHRPIWRVVSLKASVATRRIGFVVCLTTLTAASHGGNLYAAEQTTNEAGQGETTVANPPTVIDVDTVVERVFSYVQTQGLRPQPFTSEVYVRHTLQTKRSNVLMRYVPGMFKLERGTNSYFGESFARYRFNPPIEVYKKDIAAYTTMPYLRPTSDRWIGRYSLSIYAPNLFTDRILSPLNRRNRHYYRYAISRDDDCRSDSCRDTADSYQVSPKQVRIHVRPRFPNTQLVQGTFLVDTATGRVSHFDFSFNYAWTHLRVVGEMGTTGNASLLPDRLTIDSRLKLLGNVVDERFEGTILYDLSLPEPTVSANGEQALGGQKAAAPANVAHANHHDSKYDLTRQSLLRTDTTILRRDRSLFDTLRPYPLSSSQLGILRRSDSLQIAREKQGGQDTLYNRKGHRHFFTAQTEDLFLDSHTFGVGNAFHLKLPPILTPSMLQWSRSRGLSLQARIDLRATLRGDRQFLLTPRVGYNFKQHQVYWCVPFSLDLLPKAGLRFDVEAGGGDQMYSAAQADDIREQLRGKTHYDTLVSIFDAYDFHYYRDTRLLAMLSYEPVVGLRLSTGVRYHHRTLIGWNPLAAASGMSHHLTSLAPRLHIEWTPALYYYRLGHRRVPLHSRWPTFLFDYEHGLSKKNALSSRSARYERFEADAQYKLPLYALRSLFFRLGVGFYTLRGADCFIDYDYFRSNFLPWERRDELSGQFQLLDSRFYNESRHYVRLCAAYESPMLLFSRLKFLSRVVEKERVYLNLLNVDRLGLYSEAGYGLSTPLIDIAGFVAITGRSGSQIGLKVSLSLFDE